eukprot:CAMPEP_0184979742 /NCGR_PEP_ID=MMETSP1098-20130426/9899_1 /TAXON_ID=89044 /ORGANISM="Spumella elongata, Strain CCAP 955/1" /LENGTH=373 /DNA_ID=CAMNT_0027503075 /DNA_START=46 /DNA_END=1167 /DNA_ORIENTATION=-
MTQKLSKADRFQQLFDNDWKNNKSAIRNRTEDIRQYDPSYSWDAKSDNPQSFSRLQATYLPFQPTKPMTLSGPAVVLLEETDGFNSINVKQPSKVLSKVPLNATQRDLGMDSDLSGNIPFAKNTAAEGKLTLVGAQQTFKNQDLAPPNLVQGEMPEYIRAAGPNCDQRLLNPKQRREILDFEKRKKAADDLIRQAQSDRMKTKKQLSGLQFHRGALMVDSSDNMDSEIYGERAIKLAAEREYKAQIHLERTSRLAAKQSAMHLNGNILVPETVAARVQVQKHYQSKGGDFHQLSFDETHNRIFCRLQGAANGARTQHLRDVETSGKQYSITTHTTLEHWPPRSFDREVRQALTHPSQASLENQRSLQGSLRLY